MTYYRANANSHYVTGTETNTYSAFSNILGNGSEIYPVGTDIYTVYLKIKEFIVGNDATLTCELKRNKSLIMKIGDNNTTVNELKIQGTFNLIGAYFITPDNEIIPNYNVVIECVRIGDKNILNASIKNTGTFKFHNGILRTNGALDFKTANKKTDFNNVWFQSFDRSRTFAVVGSSKKNGTVIYNQPGKFDNLIFSMSADLYEAPDVINNLKLVQMDEPVIFNIRALDRGGTAKEFKIKGLNMKGDCKLTIVGSTRVFGYNFVQGSLTPFVMSANNNSQRQSGLVLYQQVKIEVVDIDDNPIEGAIIRLHDYDNGYRPKFLNYCYQIVNSSKNYKTYLSNLQEDRIYEWTTDATGNSDVEDVLIRIVWYNTRNTEFYNGIPELRKGKINDYRMQNYHDTAIFTVFKSGYEQTSVTSTLRTENGGVLSLRYVIKPEKNYIHTDTEIEAFTTYDSYTKLFEGIRYLEKRNADIAAIGGFENSLINYVGHELQLKAGWNISFENHITVLTVDTLTQTVRVPVTNNEISMDENFKNLVIDGLLTRNSFIKIKGLYEYKKDNGIIRSYHLKPLPKISYNLYNLDILDVNNTVLHHYHDNTINFNEYIEITDNIDIIIHVFGTGIFDKEVLYDAPIQRVLDFNVEVDPTTANTAGWLAKINSGDWFATITDDSIAFAGTETLVNVHAGVLRYLVDHAVTEHNINNPTDRKNVDDYITDTGLIVTIKKHVTDFNSLKILTGTTQMILNDSNESELDQDFGVTVSTSNFFIGICINLSLDDVIGIEESGVIRLIKKTDDLHERLVLRKNLINVVKVKRNGYDSVWKTLSASDPIYTTNFSKIPGLHANGLVNYKIVDDYLGVNVNNYKIIIKKDLPTSTDSNIENQRDYALWAAFDLTFPYGVKKKHIIYELQDNAVILNYEPETPYGNTAVCDAIFTDNAGIVNGENNDGSTRYDDFVVQNLSTDTLDCDINTRALKTVNNTYNAPGARFINDLNNIGNDIQFYLINTNDERIPVQASYVSNTALLYNIHFNAIYHNIDNGSRITYIVKAEEYLHDHIKVSAPLFYYKNNIVNNVDQHISWLLQQLTHITISPEFLQEMNLALGGTGTGNINDMFNNNVDLTTVENGIIDIKASLNIINNQINSTDMRISSIYDVVIDIQQIERADYKIEGDKFKLINPGETEPFLEFKGIRINHIDPTLFNGGRTTIGNS